MISQNGWPIDPPRSKRKVPGTDVSLVVADGPAGDVLMYVAAQFHARVEKLDGNDNGGYNRRPIANTGTWSNHASATAIDLEWNDHPFLRRNTFTRSQVRAIREILDEVDNVVGWGGDWGTGSVDEMHFEIRRGYDAVAKVASRLGNVTVKNPGKLQLGDSGDDVAALQRYLNRVFPAYSKLVQDGKFGPATVAVVREFQSRVGLTADGIVGPQTWAKLGF